MKNTKRVAGENLTKDAFAYVGSADDKSTWHLPIKFKSEAKTKRHIRNAIARFDQTDMPDAAKKAEAWKRIVAAAKKYGIQIADENDSKKSSAVEQQRQTAVLIDRLSLHGKADPESDDPALAWDSDAERDAECEEQREELSALPMLMRDFEVVDMTPIYDERKRDDDDDDDLPADAPLDDANNPRGDAEELANEGQDGQGQSDKNKGGKGKKKTAKKDTDKFEMSLSSEAPVERFFGKEILEHSAAAVDMSRAKLGLPFLDSHDPTRQIGIIEGLKVEGKKLRGIVRFSRNAPAQAIKRDMQDGIRKFTSVGYAVQKMVLAESSKEQGDVYRAVRWMPMEGSSVAIPADTSVGFGRAQENERTYPVEVVRNETENEGATELKEEIRSTPAPQAAPTPTVPAAPAEVRHHMDPKTAAEIIRLGKLHNIEQETVAKWVEEDRSVEQVSKEILGRIAKGVKALETPASESQEHLDLTAREQKSYNLARMLMCAGDRADGDKKANCFEMEISDHLRKRAIRVHRDDSHFIPWSIRMDSELMQKFPQLRAQQDALEAMQKRAGLFTGGATVGQTLQFTEPGEFIQFLYNSMRVKELGARTISGLRDNVSFPRQTGRATGSWVTENPGVDVADSNLTLGSIASSPKTYQSSSSYSRQLLAQAVIDVDKLVREDLARDLALAVDSVAIVGGGSNQPNGVSSTSGVQSFVDAADAGNGGAMAWADYIGMEKLLEEANADQLGEPAFLTTPQVKSTAKDTARLANTMGLPIWADDDTIDGLQARWSVQVPSNNVKGTSGATLSSIILGVWNTMLINMWGGGFEFIVDPYRLKKQGMIEITTFMLVDIVLRYPVAFVINKAVVAA